MKPSGMREVQVNLPFKPFPHQRNAHALRMDKRFLVLVWHRRAGKTVFSIMELILAALSCTKERGRFGYVAPFLKQAKEVAWDYIADITKAIPGTSFNLSELSVTMPNAAKIRLYGADNPDSLRGTYFDGVVIDEVADLRPQVWGEILRPSLSDRQGWAIFIGTPKGINLFSELYHAAQKGEDGWVADLRRATETGVIAAEEIESAKRSMGPAQYAQEFDCDFAAAVENVLIPLDAVLGAQGRVIQEQEYRYAPKVLGVDVARYGDDRSVLFPRQGLVAFKPRTFRGVDLMTLAAQVAEYCERWKPDAVFVDQGGVGGGCIDRLRQLGFAPVAVDFGGKATDPRFENKRAEMWWQMADWVKQGGCLPEGQELVTDLTAPTYTYANARGRLALESKDDLKRRGLSSPDLADALALTFAAPVAMRTEIERIGANAGGKAQSQDYNPFERRA